MTIRLEAKIKVLSRYVGLAVKLASASYPFAGFVTAGKFQTVSI
jgi:hypothetical protein